MPTHTLLELTGLVEQRAALISVGSGMRHETTTIHEWINDAIAQYELALTDHGHPNRLARTTVTTTATATANADGWPQNEFVALPTDLLELHRLAIVDGETREQLHPFTEGEVEGMYGDEDWSAIDWGWSPGRPRRYRLSRIRDASQDTQIYARLLPACDAAYTIEVIYQPEPPVLSDDADQIWVFPGTRDYIVCSACLSLMEFDGLQEQEVYQAMTTRIARCEQILAERAGRMDHEGIQTMEPPRASRRYGRRYGRYYYPGG